MSASAPPESQLGELLQKRLRLTVPQATWKVRCALKKGILMILCEHQEGAGIDTAAAFTSLRQALAVQLGAKVQEVKLFLRVAKQDIPYAQDFYTHKLIDEPFKDTETRKYAAENPDMLAPQSLHAWEQADLSEEIKYPSNPSVESEPTTFEEEEVEAFEPLSVGDPTTTRNLKPLLIGGGIFCAIAVVIGGYMLTRPCVIGGCEALDNAQQIHTQAIKQLRRATGISQLNATQQKLQTANQDLTPIPAWSLRHSQVQETQTQITTESEKITQVLTALQKADQAQTPTNPPQTWIAKQTLWRQAITPLEAIPANSELYKLAQAKLPSFRANLTFTNQKLQIEQEFSHKITDASAMATTATNLEKEAKTLADWEKITADWQVVINTLSGVPPSSSAYPEAQKLLITYQPQFTAARDRTNQEKTAAVAYNRALDVAKTAERYDGQNQVPQSVSSWSQALTAARQVPKDTIYYSQAQSLLPNYTSSLQKAQAKLKVVNILQLARTDLNRACNNGMRICTFTLNEQGINVRLTPEYEQALQQISGQGKTATGSHLQMLQQALMAISGNFGLPLVLVDARGNSLSPGG